LQFWILYARDVSIKRFVQASSRNAEDAAAFNKMRRGGGGARTRRRAQDILPAARRVVDEYGPPSISDNSATNSPAFLS
jgi:hypothetical protein